MGSGQMIEYQQVGPVIETLEYTLCTSHFMFSRAWLQELILKNSVSFQSLKYRECIKSEHKCTVQLLGFKILNHCEDHESFFRTPKDYSNFFLTVICQHVLELQRKVPGEVAVMAHFIHSLRLPVMYRLNAILNLIELYLGSCKCINNQYYWSVLLQILDY